MSGTKRNARDDMIYWRSFAAALALMVLAGCAGSWEVAYDNPPGSAVTKDWRVVNVVAVVPDTLSVSNNNTYAPMADIVWHGEPFGDRRAQVAAVLDEGLTRATGPLRGERPVAVTARVLTFHGVTPSAVARAPAAVHNIRFVISVFDAQTGEAIIDNETVSADLEANVGAAAIAAAINSQSQRQRVVDHIEAVMLGWIGFGPDQRRDFYSVGR